MDKALIDQLGGISAVSLATGASKSAVANWRLQGRKIPWRHKPAIARLAADRAIGLPAAFWSADQCPPPRATETSAQLTGDASVSPALLIKGD